MPRMPMIVATAKPLLLLLLVLLPLTMASAKAVRTTTIMPPEDTTVEELSTYSGSMELNTVTISVDADVILTTEGENQQTFTSLPENDATTTEEPLPESVVQQLEQERAEQEEKEQLPNTTTSTEDSNTATTTPASPLTTTKHGRVATTKRERLTTTMAPITTTMVPITVRSHAPYLSELKEDEPKLENLAEATTLTPIGNLASYISDEDTAKIAEDAEYYVGEEMTMTSLLEEVPGTSAPLTMEAMASNVEHSTWMPNLAEMVESTTESDPMRLMTTLPPEPEGVTELQKAVTEPTTNHPTEDTVMRLLNRLSLQAVTEMVGREPDAEIITTMAPHFESELTTLKMEPESDTGESTIAPPKKQIKLAAMMAPPTTETAESTTEISLTESPMTEPPMTASPIPASPTTETPVAEPPTTESLMHTTSTTAAPAVVATAEPKPQATRAPRIERLFNPDGVEVLYGYSNVARTNRL